MKSLLLSLMALIFVLQINAQPYQLEGDFGSGWSTYVLDARGATMGITVQATATNPDAGFLFNNASATYNPKWCGSNAPNFDRDVNILHSGGAYYYTGGGWDANLEIPMTDLYYYTFIIGTSSDANNDLSILETDYNPNDITDVSEPGTVLDMDPVNITVTLAGAVNTGEKVFVRWTNDGWATSNFEEILSFDGSFQGTITIPGQPVGTTVEYYALSTNQLTLDHATCDYFTLKLNNNTGANYSYTVESLVAFLTITADSVLTEQRLDFRSLTVALGNESFVDATLDQINFTLNNAPTGTTIENLTYHNADTAFIDLAFDGTDFASDIPDFSLTIAGVELTGGSDLTSNDLTILSYTPTIDEGIDSAKVAINAGAGLDWYLESDFEGLDMGTVNDGSTLVLNSGQLFVWKNETNGGDIDSCKMYYRVYKQGDTPGGFTEVALPWYSNNVVGDYNYQLWWNDTPEETNDNLLDYTVDAGTYNVELYYEAHNDGDVYYQNNGGSNYTGFFTYEVIPSVSIEADSVLNEQRLDFRSLTVALHNETFLDGTLDQANFTLNNAPAGTTIENLTYQDADTAIIDLAFDGTDFTLDITDFNVTVAGAELTGGSDLTSNNLTIYAHNLTIDEGIDSAKVAIDAGAGLDWYLGTDFDGVDLGTFNIESTLVLNSGQLFIWKNIPNGGDIDSCFMYYRVYRQGDTPGSFTGVFLPWYSEDISGDYNHQLWWNDDPDETNDDLILNYAVDAGVYNIELYYEAHNDGDVYYHNNSGSNYIGNFTYELIPAAVMSSDSVLTENRLDFRTLSITLQNETFVDGTLDQANFTINNAPAGTTIESLNYQTASTATIELAFDGTDFSTNHYLNVTIDGAELTLGGVLETNTLTVYPSTNVECPFDVDLGGDMAICGGSAVLLDPGYTVSPYGDSLIITYDAAQGLGDLEGSPTVYMHSGASFEIDSTWQVVTGNWGEDDGIGQMTNIGGNIWQITINPVEYYGYDDTLDILSIDCIFRNADGTLQGGDDTGADIRIELQTGTPVSSFAGVTAEQILNPYASIVWSDGSEGQTLTVNTPGEYSVIITTIDGCESGDTINIEYGDIPVVDVASDTTFCTGGSLELTVEGDFIAYEWLLYPDSVLSTSDTYIITETGTYQVNAMDSSGCVGFDVFVVNVVDPPVAEFYYDVDGLTITFSDSSENGVSYSWDFDGDGVEDSNTAGDESYTYSEIGQYYISLIVYNECTSDTFGVIVLLDNIDETGLEDDLMIYPNPTEDMLNIEFTSTITDEIRITLVNNLGQVLIIDEIEKSISGELRSYDLNTLPKGLYLIRIQTKDKELTKTIIRN